MDRITEQLSQLQELTNEQLAELEELVLNEFSSTEQQELTDQSVTQLTQLADAVEAVRAEQARRATEAQALQESAAEAAARVKGPEADVEDSDIEDAPVDAVEEEAAPASEAAVTDSELPIPSPKDDGEGIENPTVPSGDPAEPAEDPADSLENPGNDPEEEKKKTLPGVPTTTAVVEEDATAVASVDQPEGSEASAEEMTAEAELEAEAAIEDDAVAEASVETPVEAEASVEDNTNTNTNMEATVTAAAQGGNEGLNIEVPAGHEPVTKSPTTTVSITAGADIPGITAGTTFANDLEVADAFQKRLHTLRHVHGGDGEQHIVASYRQEFPESRFLSPNDPLSNTGRIQDVTSQEALVAGACLPLETNYDMGCDVGVTDRPVRDALARFGSDRGGIRFFSAPTLSQTNPAFANATGFWRGDQSDPNSGAWHTYGPDRTSATVPADQKPCLELNCVEEKTAYIEAVTLCLTFNNLTTRTFPELIKRQNELALVAHARVAENALLAQIEDGSTKVSAQTQVVGATREILNLLDRAVASYRFKHRMSNSSPLRAILPVWVKNLLRADIALQMPGDGIDVFDLADSKIDGWFRSRNVNPAYHLDGVGPALVDADASSAVNNQFELPSTLEFALFAEGTWLFLDGGTLDLGVIRDSSLVATNQYKQFVESFEGVANVGCDSYWVSAAYEPTGAAAALVETP